MLCNSYQMLFSFRGPRIIAKSARQMRTGRGQRQDHVRASHHHVPRNRRGKARLGKKVHTDGRLGIKPTQSLEIASGPRFKAYEPLLDAVVNGGVIADIKV